MTAKIDNGPLANRVAEHNETAHQLAKLKKYLEEYLLSFDDAPWDPELETRLPKYLHTLLQCTRPLVEQYPLCKLVHELTALNPSYMGNLEQYLAREIETLSLIRVLFREANQIREVNLRREDHERNLRGGGKEIPPKRGRPAKEAAPRMTISSSEVSVLLAEKASQIGMGSRRVVMR
jgi:hypothetical protein